MQVIPCSLLLLVLGASGETDGCADTTSLLQRSVTPHSDTACPCIMGDWGDWGDCSATCGGGSRIRSRAVKKEATNGGKCDEDKEDKETCNVDACPKDCVVSEWLEWSCSVTCGEGTKTRTRILEAPAEHGGNKEKCQPLLEEDKCKPKDCPPEPCEWDDWSDWGHCSKSCGGGQKYRDRKVKKEAKHGGETCDEDDQTDKKPCATDPCPIDCKVTSWSGWSDCNGECCDGKCGTGTQTRKRSITQHPKFGGKQCPEDLFDERDCDTGIPCPIPCEWEDWSSWSGCSVTCGTGDRTRNREEKVEAKYGGKECNGTKKEVIPCGKDDCPIPCDYSWEDWSPCTRTCGGGVRTRKIDIISEPKFGGAPCPPEPDPEACNTSPECECKWGEWEDWTTCSKSCGTGTKTHYRKAISEPKYGLDKCNEEEGKDTIDCVVIPYCPEDCEVSDWGDWSKCTECGPGHSRSRAREITRPPQHGGKDCPPLTDTGPCPEPHQPCPIPVPCEWAPWSDWGECDTTCDKGNQQRTRGVEQEAENGGKKCQGNSTEARPCPDYIKCPIDCEMGDWDEGSTCPRTCGGGEQKRQRTVTREAAHGGEKCGPKLDTKDCATKPCPHCCYTEWSDWGECTDKQKQSRTRQVDEDWKDENKISHECTETEETRDGVDCGGIVNPDNVDFKVCGHVRNAFDNAGVSQAKVAMAGKTTLTDDTGAFCIEKVPAGDQTITANKDDYVGDESVVNVDADKDDVVLLLNQKLPPKDWRIVLTWGAAPLDLDARTNIGNNWNGQSPNDNVDCDVSYDARDVTCPKNNIGGKLDLDHCFYSKDEKYTCSKDYTPGGPSHEAKPETTTLTNVDPEKCGDDCSIVFHVSNYMVCKQWGLCEGGHYPAQDTGTLSDSKAKVKVIHGGEQVAFFELAKGDGKIRYSEPYSEWWVFSIDVKTGKVADCKDIECFPLPGI